MLWINEIYVYMQELDVTYSYDCWSPGKSEFVGRIFVWEETKTINYSYDGRQVEEKTSGFVISLDGKKIVVRKKREDRFVQLVFRVVDHIEYIDHINPEDGEKWHVVPTELSSEELETFFMGAVI
jgi:hypothetical protein